MNKIAVSLAALAVLGGGAYWFFGRGAGGGAAELRFRTSKADRGEVIEGVQASGTVQPVLLVQVGTQVSGVIEKLFADFNSKVKANQTIALLDTRRLEAQVMQDEALVTRSKADLERMKAVVEQSRSDVDHAKATLEQSKADVDRIRALLEQAEKDLARQKELGAKRLVSAADVDAAVATKGSLDAQLAAAQATIRSNEVQVATAEATVRTNVAQLGVGEAAITQNEAQLKGDKVNLDYATIVSPVDGVIVSRNVDVGQTVAASLSAPTLFVIANDLTKIQVQASVPEADVGKIKESQHARFTVDAHPERTFDGNVSQVRLASTTVQNVVTYTVMVDASNPDGLLLPGMTANITFEISKSAKDALHVPAAALRLQVPTDAPNLVDNPEVVAEASKAEAAKLDAAKPDGAKPETATAEGAKPDAAGADGAKAEDRHPGGGRAGASSDGTAAAPSDGGGGGGGGPGGGKWKKGGGRRRRGLIYVQVPGGKVHAVPVRIGTSDGINTVVEPIEPATIADGADVVTAILREEEAATTNPFAPPGMGGRPGGGAAGRGGR
jgi:HlyD family secretion protein